MIFADKTLSIGDIFQFADRQDVEPFLSSDGMHTFYLFQCNGLLGQGLTLAIDEQSEMIGVCQDHNIINEIPVNTVEIFVLTLLILSSPLPIYDRMMQNICIMHKMKEGKSDVAFKKDIGNLVNACNEKLKKLNLAIASMDETYQLIICP